MIIELKPRVSVVPPRLVFPRLIESHYLHRKPPITQAYALTLNNADPFTSEIMGIATVGVPASRHLQKSVCPKSPDLVLELNRVWLDDSLPKNMASWFLSRCFNGDTLGVTLLCSYADTSVGHQGYMYRACNWNYAGWTDMDRKTPRFDYVSPGKHSRDAFRSGYTEKVRRKPKVKYWKAIGDKKTKKWLESICGWPKLDWKSQPPPMENHNE